MIDGMGRGLGTETLGAGLFGRVSARRSRPERVHALLTTIDARAGYHSGINDFDHTLGLSELYSRLFYDGITGPSESGRSPVAQVTEWAARQMSGPRLRGTRITVHDGDRSRPFKRPATVLTLELTASRQLPGGASKSITIEVTTGPQGKLRLPDHKCERGRGTRSGWSHYLTDVAELVDHLHV
jgi:hypothetical protein